MRNYKYLNKIIIILALLIVAVSVLFYFVASGIKSKNENIAKLKSDLSVRASEKEYLFSMQNMLNKVDTSISQIDSSVLSSDGDVSIIENIEQIAKKNGLDVSIDSLSIEDLPSTLNSGMTTLKIRAKTEGNWSSIYNFVYELSSLPYKIKIERFLLTAVPGTSTVKGSTGRQWQNVFEIRLLKYK